MCYAQKNSSKIKMYELITDTVHTGGSVFNKHRVLQWQMQELADSGVRLVGHRF